MHLLKEVLRLTAAGLSQRQIARSLKLSNGVVAIGLACVPEGFEFGKDRIPWYWEDNRAFLRAYENLGGCYLDLGDGYVDKALDTFQQLLMLNPDDFGVSDLVRKLQFLSGNEITDDSDSSSVPQP
jgi:hypothetical protein